NPIPPSELFRTIIAIEPAERKRIVEARSRSRGGSGQRLQLFQDFWSTTFHEALDTPFRGVALADAQTLRELLNSFDTPEGRLA
ncbi:MAG: hypothetical protein LC799_02820, partial [Actinobacteria bacterium]|nr:hypothetical protein [Actinomycetota bacterium]